MPTLPSIHSQKLREILLREGLRDIPKLLELADRNYLSDTYGCFDRAYWHYRTIDFPSGMYQEAVLPLALAYLIPHSENPYYQQARLKELVIAGIGFSQKSSHRDGSTDDYFPFERAAGATAFSLYACTEAYLLLQLEDKSGMINFFKRRARYLAESGCRESGILSNHKALNVLALYNVFLITGEAEFRCAANSSIEELLKLQSAEGWFPEYEGCDPGYLTFTIDFLAKYYRKSGEEKVQGPILKAIEFASYFVHPDGSYGGEYGSRNTFHFLPHGFELMARESPWATWMVNRFLHAVRHGKHSYLEDDRIFIHYPYNFFQAYQDFCLDREASEMPREENFVKYFPEAGLYVKNQGKFYAVISLAKGGVGKYFRGGELVYSDAGLVGRAAGGEKFISQVIDRYQVQITEESITVEGYCYAHRDVVMTPFLFLLFRFFLLACGRFFPPNFVRKIIQKKAITRSRAHIPLKFSKTIDVTGFEEIRYTITLEDPALRIDELWIGTDPTFIYVATSQPYQEGNLKTWSNLSPYLPELHAKRTVSFTEKIL